MRDPQLAQAAGITMRYFDPTINQRTEKYLLFEAKLKEIMDIVKAEYTKRTQSTNTTTNTTHKLTIIKK